MGHVEVVSDVAQMDNEAKVEQTLSMPNSLERPVSASPAHGKMTESM
jgi:hypothetical protein